MRPWMDSGPPAPMRPDTASMGPRPCGRGWDGAVAAVYAGDAVLQWGHGLAAVVGCAWPGMADKTEQGFNGATALRPWMALPYLDARHTAFGFNGATALRPWMAGRAVRHVIAAGASMGPRPCGRGWAAATQTTRRRPICFNGATALRPWMVLNPRQLQCESHASMGPRPCGRGWS